MSKLTLRLLTEVNRLLASGIGGSEEYEDLLRLLNLCARDEEIDLFRVEGKDGRFRYVASSAWEF